MNKAVFLDRDGTINIEKDYLHRKEDFEFIPGVIEGLIQLQKAGYKLFIITNQSGIARGYYTEDDFRELTAWMLETMALQGVDIQKVYYCPHLPTACVLQYKKDCNCRKPKTGMIEKAVADFQIDLNKSYVIGDRIRDCTICLNTNCKGFVIGETESVGAIEKIKNKEYLNVEYRKTFLDCVKEIVKEQEV